jgi:hypothetical protein
MKISNLRLERKGSIARVLARVTWEDNPRPGLDLFFETDSRFAEDLPAGGESFLTACALPAMYQGERRISLEGEVCPRLAAGVTAAADLLRAWYGPPRGRIAVEAARLRTLPPLKPERTAVFLTAGIDSLHLIQTNRKQYFPGHPDRFADGVAVFGHLSSSDTSAEDWNNRLQPVLREVSSEAQLEVVPIRTNVWEIEPDTRFIADESLSSALVSAAHALGRRWTNVSIASGRDAARLELRGTHPILDPLLSSSGLEVRHVGIRFQRFERLDTLASWPKAIEHLVVCLDFPPPPFLNCGACEKCVRTMTSLLALGRLSETRHFPFTEVVPEMIRPLFIGPLVEDYWRDLLPLLAREGRRDLVKAIEEGIVEGRRAQRWLQDAGWKGWLRRADRRLFRGQIRKIRSQWASPRSVDPDRLDSLMRARV